MVRETRTMAGTKKSSPGNLHKPIILKKTKPLAVVRVSRTTLSRGSCLTWPWFVSHEPLYHNQVITIAKMVRETRTMAGDTNHG